MSKITYKDNNGFLLKKNDLFTKIYVEDDILKMNGSPIRTFNTDSIHYQENTNYIPAFGENISKINMINGEKFTQILFADDKFFISGTLNTQDINLGTGIITADNIDADNINAIDSKVDKNGDTLTGTLTFQNSDLILNNNKIILDNSEIYVNNYVLNFYSTLNIKFSIAKEGELFLNTIFELNNDNFIINGNLKLTNSVLNFSNSQGQKLYFTNDTNQNYISYDGHYTLSYNLGNINNSASNTNGSFSIATPNGNGYDDRIIINNSDTLITNELELVQNNFTLATKSISTDSTDLFFDSKKLESNFDNSQQPSFTTTTFTTDLANTRSLCNCMIDNRLLNIRINNNLIEAHLTNLNSLTTTTDSTFNSNLNEKKDGTYTLNFGGNQPCDVKWCDNNYGLFVSIGKNSSSGINDNIYIHYFTKDNETLCRLDLYNLIFESSYSVTRVCIAKSHTNIIKNYDTWYLIFSRNDGYIYISIVQIYTNSKTIEIKMNYSNNKRYDKLGFTKTNGFPGENLPDLDSEATRFQLESFPNYNSGVLLCYRSSNSPQLYHIDVYVYVNVNTYISNYIPIVYDLLPKKLNNTNAIYYNPCFTIRDYDFWKKATNQEELDTFIDVDILLCCQIPNDGRGYLINYKRTSLNDRIVSDETVCRHDLDLAGQYTGTNEYRKWFPNDLMGTNITFNGCLYIKKINKYLLTIRNFGVFIDADTFLPCEINNITNLSKRSDYPFVFSGDIGSLMGQLFATEDNIYYCSHDKIRLITNLNYAF